MKVCNKNETGIVFRLHQIWLVIMMNLPHELLLINRQVANLWEIFDFLVRY